MNIKFFYHSACASQGKCPERQIGRGGERLLFETICPGITPPPPSSITRRFSNRLKQAALFLFALLFSVSTAAAKETLDSAIKSISSDIQKPVKNGAIVCILDFASPSAEMSEYIQAELSAHAIESGKIKIVTRAHMDKVNKELNYQMSGFVSDETALSICKRLGGQAIVFGQLKELDNKYNLQVKMIEVESAAYILFRTYEFDRTSKSEQLLGRAAIYSKVAVGITAEISKNAIEYVALGGGISFDYTFFRRVSAGIKVNASSDIFNTENSLFTIEPLGTLRFYAVSPTGEPATGLFIEGQAGASILSVNAEMKGCFNIGVCLGLRQPLGNFYLEPFIRGGYPYLFGAGINAGFRF